MNCVVRRRPRDAMDAVLGLVRRPCVDRADGGDRSTPASHLDALEVGIGSGLGWGDSQFPK